MSAGDATGEAGRALAADAAGDAASAGVRAAADGELNTAVGGELDSASSNTAVRPEATSAEATQASNVANHVERLRCTGRAANMRLLSSGASRWTSGAASTAVSDAVGAKVPGALLATWLSRTSTVLELGGASNDSTRATSLELCGAVAPSACDGCTSAVAFVSCATESRQPSGIFTSVTFSSRLLEPALARAAATAARGTRNVAAL